MRTPTSTPIFTTDERLNARHRFVGTYGYLSRPDFIERAVDTSRMCYRGFDVKEAMTDQRPWAGSSVHADRCERLSSQIEAKQGESRYLLRQRLRGCGAAAHIRPVFVAGSSA